jgi:hypothetical protein
MVGLDAAAPADLVELLAPLSVVASAAPPAPGAWSEQNR